MNLQDIDDFNCSICFDLYGEGPRCPRMLSCGHTYCHACLEKLLVVPKPFCPTCKEEIQTQRVELIPVNYTVKNVIKKLATKESYTGQEYSIPEVTQNVPTSDCESLQNILKFTKTSAQRESKYLSEGYCEEHDCFKYLRCTTCSLLVCGMCVALYHKQCRTIQVEEALREMKGCASQKVKTEREFQKSATSTTDRLIKFFENTRKELKESMKVLQMELRNEIEKFKTVGRCLEKLMSRKKEQIKCCDKLESFDSLVLKSSDYTDFTKVTNSVENYLQEIKKDNLGFQIQKEVISILKSEDLKLLCEQETVYSCRHHDEKTQCGKVVIRDGSVWVHSFCTQNPDRSTILVPFQQLLLCFGGFTTLPQKAFLKISCEDSDYGDVVITTTGSSPRTLNFLLNCAGINGQSYKGQRLVYNDERSEATFRFTVPNLSQLKGYDLSPRCFVSNLPWRICVRPKTNIQSKKYLGLYLWCDGMNDSDSWACQAEYELRLLSVNPGQESFKIKKGEHMFTSIHFLDDTEFMSWDEVLDPAKGYIKDDSITLEVWISADSPTGVTWEAEKQIGCITLEMETRDEDRRSSMVKTIKGDGILKKPARGFVYGFTFKQNKVLSDFSICMEDASSALPLLGKFGEVESGMEILKMVKEDITAGRQVIIQDSGVIL